MGRFKVEPAFDLAVRNDVRIRSSAAFTLLELLTVIIVIGILAVMITQPFLYVRERANHAKCRSNLVQLYVAATAYVADHQSWPQISSPKVSKPKYAQDWIDALTPYQISRGNWICPSIQLQLRNPFYGDPRSARIDYVATSFDSQPHSPSQYPTHPWFSERGDMHGDGNLILFANGEIKSLKQVLRDTRGKVIDW